MIDALIRHFSVLEDPRCAGKVEHRLLDIVVIAVCAVIACAESFEDMALYGRSKQEWLQQFLALPNGIPSHDTFRRVLMLLQPHAFERCFQAWAHALTEPLPREVIAIDGKTVRGSFDSRQRRGPLHLVSAWACEQGVSLGQQCVAHKSNEITAIPLLLESLQLENSLVTLDAMGCQTKIAGHILDRKADYLLVLKANHRHDYSAVKAHFLDGSSHPTGHLVFDAFDDFHGRCVRRRVFISQDPTLLATLASWPALQSVFAVESIRSVNGHTKVESQVRYFLSSAKDDPALLAQAIRRHWAIENNLHWVLDVTFKEDESRVREHNAVCNWAVLRKIALNLLGRDPTKISLKAKRKKRLGTTIIWLNYFRAVSCVSPDPQRALQFAQERARGARNSRGAIEKPFVLGAVLNLKRCLDLADSSAIAQMQRAHQIMRTVLLERGVPLPSNGGELKSRRLDCLVFNTVHELRAEQGLPAYDTVRGLFWEGSPIYEGAGVSELNHIQICVRDVSCILGYFRPIALQSPD